MNIRITSKYNVVQDNITTNYDLSAKTYDLINASVTVSRKRNITGIIKVDFMAKQLYLDCIRLYCT